MNCKRLHTQLIGAAMVLITAVSAGTGAFARSTKADITRNIHIFNQVYRELQSSYVDTIDATATMRTAIDALLGQIDPYTEYYSAAEQDKLTSVSSGEYAGIGSMIMKRDTTIVLSEPQWDSPARKAGVRHGDILLSIDGETIDRNYTTEKASSKLKGQAGTEVKLRVRRPWLPAGSDSIFDITITRGTISIDAIPYSGFVADGIGYIDVSTFSDKTAGDFSKALDELNAKALAEGGKLKGLIIDLRANGGGLLTAAVQMASNFVPKGTEIVTTRYRDARDTQTYKTTGRPGYVDLPLVVLVDGNTASASEIFAGSMQDLDRAVIVGERSYGKGLVQQGRNLPYGSMMKVTTGRYYLPSGRLVQAIDYSHRNTDGQAQRIPDSLTTVYHTRAGRIVRDGGGITPEVTMEDAEASRLIYNIAADLWAYDFANKVANNTPADSIPDPMEWNLDDATFNEFTAFIDPERFKYDRVTELGVKYLREAAEAEGYMNDSVDATLRHLEKLMRHDLQRDLQYNRDEITELLENEIGQRWFSTGDMLRRVVRTDRDVQEAIRLLQDPRQYGVLLTPAGQPVRVPHPKGKKDKANGKEE